MGVYWLVANHDKKEYIDPKGSMKLHHQLHPDGICGMLVANLAMGGWSGDRISMYSDESDGDVHGSYHSVEAEYMDVTANAVLLSTGYVGWRWQ